MSTLLDSPRTEQYLYFTNRASALSFTSFLVLHLSAPLAAAIAPSRAAEAGASRFMLLGRVWYQGEWSEGLFVWGSVGLHIASGVLLRCVKGRKARSRRSALKFDAEESIGYETELRTRFQPDKDAPDLSISSDTEVLNEKGFLDVNDEEENAVLNEDVRSRSFLRSTFLGAPFTWQHLTGYALVPIVLHHSFLHRVLPSSSKVPISSLSPNSFFYSFVTYSISSPLYGIPSVIAYAAVLSIGTYHGLTGLRKIWDPTAPSGLGPKWRKSKSHIKGGKESKILNSTRGRAWQGAWAATMAGVGIGVARIVSDGFVTGRLAKRYDAVLRTGWGY